MSTTERLVAFLRARFDEEAATARTAWEVEPHPWRTAGPTRLLRDVQAKRRLLERTEASLQQAADGVLDAMHDTCRHFATVYVDHPDYDPAWALQPVPRRAPSTSAA